MGSEGEHEEADEDEEEEESDEEDQEPPEPPTLEEKEITDKEKEAKDDNQVYFLFNFIFMLYSQGGGIYWFGIVKFFKVRKNSKKFGNLRFKEKTTFKTPDKSL